MGMVDVGAKPIVRREAVAEGRILLRPATIEVIRRREVRKGDPFVVAEVAAMTAAKQTHLLIPHCHQIALDLVEVAFDMDDKGILATCKVVAQARTGVEMEAIVAVSSALNTLWDMLKYLEKNVNGQYPETMISEIRVVKKLKGI